MKDPAIKEKLLIISVTEDETIEAAGGEYVDGAVVTSLRSFGQFAIGIDTVAPHITPLYGNVSGDLSGKKAIKFTIVDDLSGIKKYEGYIDNHWVLFEYDMKNDLISYTFDNDRIDSGSEHELELYVSDNKGNVNLFHTTFTW